MKKTVFVGPALLALAVACRFVDRTLPKLREHLAAAEKLAQSGKDAAAMGNRKS
ncbi:MAG TPA: hypothetical protein VLK85_11200 [Ramlibacter sp.]|nr:hypothetical protein [Ramlibacter sp.]